MRTLLVGGVIFLVLVVVALTVPVPYVVLSPGPTINTLGDYRGQVIISITDGKTANPTTGNLNLTTVSISTNRVSAFQALAGWLAGDEVVVPRETIYPPGQSQQQVNQQDKQDFTDSQQSAEVAAFCQLRTQDPTEYQQYFGVTGTSSEIKPTGALKIGDRLISVNGTAVSDITTLKKVLAGEKAGSVATIDIVRQKVASTVKVTLNAAPSGQSGAVIGINAGTSCFAPFDVTLGLNNDIGGPSAGMMFALGIMEKVGNTDLTGGRFVAGTGTIDNTGAVGAIGGIQLKMIAARRAGATLFLAPASNCSDVRGHIPKGLTVAKVSTLSEAIDVLAKVKAGQSVGGC